METNAEKPLPRGHSYIRMRNRGYCINIDFMEIDSHIAEEMINAAMAVYRKHLEEEGAE